MWPIRRFRETGVLMPEDDAKRGRKHVGEEGFKGESSPDLSKVLDATRDLVRRMPPDNAKEGASIGALGLLESEATIESLSAFLESSALSRPMLDGLAAAGPVSVGSPEVDLDGPIKLLMGGDDDDRPDLGTVVGSSVASLAEGLRPIVHDQPDMRRGGSIPSLEALDTNLSSEALAAARLATSVMDPNYRLVRHAVALSGGGSRGDFEVGALKFLYDDVFGGRTDGFQRRPDIITGTSVGAINATKLADGFDASIEELEAIWLRLRHNQDMYGVVLDFDAMVRDVRRAGEEALPGLLLAGLASGFTLLSPLVLSSMAIAAVSVGSVAADALRRVNGARSMFNLRPIEQLIENSFEPYWTPTGPGLRGRSAAAGLGRSGDVMLFVRSYKDQLYVKVQRRTPDADSVNWSSWLELGGRIDSDPVVVQRDGVVESVVVRMAQDGRFHRLVLRGDDPSRRDSWSDFEPLGWPAPIRIGGQGTVGGPQSVFYSHPTVLDFDTSRPSILAARGPYDLPFSNRFDPSPGAQRWTGWAPMGYPVPIAGSVTLARDGSGAEFAFARGRDRSVLYQHTYQWRSFGATATSDISAVRNVTTGLIDVVCRAPNGRVSLRCQAASGDAWTDGWRDLGGQVVSNIAVGIGVGDRAVLAARGLDGGIWVKSQLAAGGPWPDGDGNWNGLGSPPVGEAEADPLLVRNRHGRLELYVVAKDQAVWTRRQEANGSWSPWESLHGCVWTGIRMRLATVSLEDGELRHVDQSGRFVGTSEPAARLRDAVIASSSIPAIFPAVPINGRAWVDGGVRSITPIAAAIEAGADEVFAIVATSPHPEPPRHAFAHIEGFGPAEVDDWSRANFVPVGLRAATELLTLSIMEAELHPPGGWSKPVYVIQPSFDLHSPLTIDPGLIRIAHAYGWMRAFDVVFAFDTADAMSTSDNIIGPRRRAWQLEELLIHQIAMASERTYRDPDEPDRDPSERAGRSAAIAQDAVRTLDEIRGIKRDLRDAVRLRRGNGHRLPDNATEWFQRWEAHRRTLAGTPWSALTVSPMEGSAASRPAQAVLES